MKFPSSFEDTIDLHRAQWKLGAKFKVHVIHSTLVTEAIIRIPI